MLCMMVVSLIYFHRLVKRVKSIRPIYGYVVQRCTRKTLGYVSKGKRMECLSDATPEYDDDKAVALFIILDIGLGING